MTMNEDIVTDDSVAADDPTYHLSEKQVNERAVAFVMQLDGLLDIDARRVLDRAGELLYGCAFISASEVNPDFLRFS